MFILFLFILILNLIILHIIWDYVFEEYQKRKYWWVEYLIFLLIQVIWVSLFIFQTKVYDFVSYIISLKIFIITRDIIISIYNLNYLIKIVVYFSLLLVIIATAYHTKKDSVYDFCCGLLLWLVFFGMCAFISWLLK